MFSRTQLFFTNLHSTAYTAYDTYQQHLETARLAQGKLWATYESSEAVPHHLTVAWHSRRAAWMLHGQDAAWAGCCVLSPRSTPTTRRATLYIGRRSRATSASSSVGIARCYGTNAQLDRTMNHTITNNGMPTPEVVHGQGRVGESARATGISERSIDRLSMLGPARPAPPQWR